LKPQIGWSTLAVTVGLAGSVAVFATAVSAAGTTTSAALAGCTLDHATTQICPVTFTVKAGKLAHLTVARYGDYSNCNFTSPPSQPGNNGRYIVASVSINWGDGSRPTAGVARRGSSCAGTGTLDETGQIEPITGVHRYKKHGRDQVTVTIWYVRSASNTYQNCATYTRGSLVHNDLSNCIGLGAPVHSSAIVRT